DQPEIDLLREADIRTVDVTVPWVNHEWFFQVGAYLAYKGWGLNGPIFYKCAILVLAYFFVLITVYRRDTHLVGLVAVFLAAITSYKRFFMRPEVFSILFTAVWLYVLERFRRRPTWSICWTLPPCMVIWINAHGYFILGPAVMLIYLIGDGLQSVLPMPRVLTRQLRWRDDLIRGRALGILAVATVLTVAATFINPYGVAGARYPIDVLEQVADPTSVIRTVIGEMQPPWQFFYTDAVFYTWVLIWLASASWVLNLRRWKLSRLLLFVVSILFVDKALRNMPFFGIPGAVIFALNVNESWPETLRFLREKVIPEALIAAKWAAQAALALLFGFYLVWMPSDRFYVHDVGTVRFGLGYTGLKFSMGAVEWIRNSGVRGHLFNAFGMGGLCMWKLYPEERDGELHYGGRKLLIDGRAEVYGGPFVKNYTNSLASTDESKALWNALDEKFHFQVVFINWQAADTRPLMERLYRDPRWTLCFGDGVGYVFVRELQPGEEDRIKDPGLLDIMKHNYKILQRVKQLMKNPEPLFVDLGVPYRRLVRLMPGLPSHEDFVRRQDRIWVYAKIMCPDPAIAARALEKSDHPTMVLFDRTYFTNGYDRLQRELPFLPQRMLSPGEMLGRSGFAMFTSRFPIEDYLPSNMLPPDYDPSKRPPDTAELANAIVDGLIHLQGDEPSFYLERAQIYQQMAGRAQQIAAGEPRITEEKRKELMQRVVADYDMAVRYFLKGQAIQPDYPGISLSLMRMYLMRGDLDKAREYLAEAKKLPTNMATIRAITEVCLNPQVAEYKLALRQFQSALRTVPERDALPVYERIAYCCQKDGQPDEALHNARVAVDLILEPDSDAAASAWTRLGEIHLLLAGPSSRKDPLHLRNAVDALQRALAVNPRNPNAWMALAAAHGAQGQLPEAQRDLEETLRINGRYLPAWRQLARVVEKQGKLRDAVGVWERVLRIQPNLLEAQDEIRRLQRLMSRPRPGGGTAP
ncbi:MAG TPA: hypothetical protein VMY39_01975, partial [Planctomycetota bacterium]|nr:hypothetical protein [Planctomycetota bacterium]